MAVKVTVTTSQKDDKGNPLPSGQVNVLRQERTKSNGLDADGNPHPMGWETRERVQVADDTRTFQVSANERIIVEST